MGPRVGSHLLQCAVELKDVVNGVEARLAATPPAAAADICSSSSDIIVAVNVSKGHLLPLGSRRRGRRRVCRERNRPPPGIPCSRSTTSCSGTAV